MRKTVLLALWLCGAAAFAKEPQGPEFRVNTTTDGNQGIASDGGRPVSPVAVAARDDGSFVVIWNQVGNGPFDNPRVFSRLHGQRYNAGGQAEGGEFQIENGETSYLDVAMAPDGAFVVTWRDFVTNHIEARRYTAAGQPAGDAFVVSDTHTSRYAEAPCARVNYIAPQVAMAADGAFVVLWTCAQGSANFPTGAIFARYYDGEGFPSDGFVTLGNFNSHGFLGGTQADAVMTSTGYQVIFQGPCRIAPGSDTYSAPCLQAFNTIGESQGDTKPLGPQRPFGQVGSAGPQIARDAAGRFAAIWQATFRDAEGAETTQLISSSFNADATIISTFGFPLGEVARNSPCIAMANSSTGTRFVVSYQRAIPDDSDDRSEVVAREFELGGASTPVGTFVAHSNTSADHQFPAAAMDADGDYILAWTRIENIQGDVYARRFGGTPPPPPANGNLRFVATDPNEPALAVPEANGSVVVSVERINGSFGAASASLALETNFSPGGEALLGVPDDINASPTPSTLSWADGESGPKSASFSLVDDALDEFEEIAFVTLANASGASAAGAPKLQLIVVDDDDPPSAQFASASSNASEGGGSAQLEVQLSGPSGKPISLACSFSGTAQLQADYTVSDCPLEIPDGATAATISITPVDDTVEEAEESILVDLDFNNSIHVTAGERVRHLITLAASDTALRADLRATLSNTDSTPHPVGSRFDLIAFISNFGPNFASSAFIELQLSEGRIASFSLDASRGSCTRSNLDRKLNCALNGIAVDELIPVALTIEAPAEPGEFQLLHTVGGGPGDPNAGNNTVARTFTARPLNPGVVRLTEASFEIEEGDSGAGCKTVTAARTGGEGSASVAVGIVAGGPATENVDFEIQLSDRRLGFLEGPSSVSFFMCVLGDAVPEDLEAVVLQLTDPINTTIDAEASTFTFVIKDDDEGPGDRKPNPFTTTNSSGQSSQTGVAAGAPVTTEPVTVSGLGGPAPISVSTGGTGGSSASKRAEKSAGTAQYSINGGDFTSADGTVNNGDVVRLRVFASSTPGQTVTATLNIGGVTSQFSVTTAANTVEVRAGGSWTPPGLMILLLAGLGRRLMRQPSRRRSC